MATYDARSAWLSEHPFLGPVARLDEAVERAVAASVPAPLSLPDWHGWEAEAARGRRLLGQAGFGRLVATRLAEVLPHAAAQLDAAALPSALGVELADLRTVVTRSPADAAEWVLSHGEADQAPAHPGLLRLLGWAVVRRLLVRVHEELAPGGGAPPWSRGFCPCCGALPATAQLVELGGGRQRVLGCGLCGTRWRFKRVGCPHCGNEAPGTLEVMDVEGEAKLRLDTCRECQGYVKTDLGVGREALLGADWPTLHLDALAAERGFVRHGPSLFDP